MADTVSVTQADREAMEHWVSMCCDLSFDVSDAESLVQAFARHRLASTQSAPAFPREEVAQAARFLLDRLVDHEVRMTSDEDAREWHGHVTPAMARLRALLQGKQP